jgi:hypothetical protein
MTSWLDMHKEFPKLRGQKMHSVEAETGLLIPALVNLGFTVYVINGSKIIDDKTFFEEAARVFAFPPYFGYGWASWDDSLGDFGSLAPSRTAIVWEHADETFNADAQTFLQAVCDLYNLAMYVSVYPTRYPDEGLEAKQFELFFLGRGGGFTPLDLTKKTG